MGVNKNSEAFDSARSEYIEGYEEKNKLTFPTLKLVAKEFKISLSTLRKKAANEGWFKKRKHHQNYREEFEMRKQFKGNIPSLHKFHATLLSLLNIFKITLTKK